MPPDNVQPVKRLNVSLAGNEIENRVINLTNVSGRTLTMLIRNIGESLLAPSVEFFLPIAVRARDGSQPMDALVPLAGPHTARVSRVRSSHQWLRPRAKMDESSWMRPPSTSSPPGSQTGSTTGVSAWRSLSSNAADR